MILPSYLTPKFSNIVDILLYRAACQPEQTAYIFLQDGETKETHLNYYKLNKRSQVVAAQLRSFIPVGERALLLYPSGLEFITAFLGCLHAGIVAVPAYPPRHNQNSKLRLQAIATDVKASIVLTTTSILSNIKNKHFQDLKLSSLHWLATDNMDDFSQKLTTNWQKTEISPNSQAFIQYTSGSTGMPKGVIVTHSNLIYNEYMIAKAYKHSTNTVVVGWLPLFHDMGLVGNIIQPLYLGVPSILMSPVSFLQKPLRWLQAISRYRATSSGAPNFAYDLCIHKITPEQRSNLDLSSWEVAFSGAETVRAQTLEKFANTFADNGFNRKAFYPCYGMAETTLIVSGGLKAEYPITYSVDKQALKENRVTRALEKEKSKVVVSCGQIISDQKVAIIDPESFNRCLPDRIGEIWVSGKNVAQGYFNNREQTEKTFNAYVKNTGEGPFLRTGDLGFIKDGELFVTGRCKDLIIIRGRNHYPQDIELTVEQSHAALRSNCGAAFAVEVKGEEKLAIVQEVERSYLKTLNTEKIITGIRQAVTQQHEIEVYAVLLLKTGSIPKTSSGKIQRYRCKAKFLDDSLVKVGEWYSRNRSSNSLIGKRESFELKGKSDRISQPLSSSCARSRLISQLAYCRDLAPEDIDPSLPFSHYGLTSLEAIELTELLEGWINCSLSAISVWDYPSINSLSEAIANLSISKSISLSGTQTIDLETEAVLKPTICHQTQSVKPITNPNNVLLTGATGFLGSFLLDELLRHTQADIYCLIRATDIKLANKRLKDKLSFYKIWNSNSIHRIIPVLGDLSQPNLGLTYEKFQYLARQIDSIYHSGAALDFTYSYTKLKAVNVLGTQEILRLAGLFKTKALHYVSSVSVFESKIDPQKAITESDVPTNGDKVYLGYSQSKWVAEKLVIAARNRGLPVCIYRPSLISGDSRTGIWNTNDFLCRLIKGCIQMNKSPDLDYQLNISPVDYVSQAIVYLSIRKTSFGKAFHLTNPSPIHWKQLTEYLNLYGYPVEQIAYDRWQKQLIRTQNDDIDANTLYPLKPFFSRKLSNKRISIPELYQSNQKSKIRCEETLKLLDGSSIKCPKLDYQLLTVYFSYFV